MRDGSFFEHGDRGGDGIGIGVDRR